MARIENGGTRKKGPKLEVPRRPLGPSARAEAFDIAEEIQRRARLEPEISRQQFNVAAREATRRILPLTRLGRAALAQHTFLPAPFTPRAAGYTWGTGTSYLTPLGPYPGTAAHEFIHNLPRMTEAPFEVEHPFRRPNVTFGGFLPTAQQISAILNDPSITSERRKKFLRELALRDPAHLYTSPPWYPGGFPTSAYPALAGPVRWSPKDIIPEARSYFTGQVGLDLSKAMQFSQRYGPWSLFNLGYRT